MLYGLTPCFHLHFWGRDLEIVDEFDDVDVGQPIQRIHLMFD